MEAQVALLESLRGNGGEVHLELHVLKPERRPQGAWNASVPGIDFRIKGIIFPMLCIMRLCHLISLKLGTGKLPQCKKRNRTRSQARLKIKAYSLASDFSFLVEDIYSCRKFINLGGY